MTKKEAARWANVWQSLYRYGVSPADVDSLFRIERALSRWSEHECNGHIQREGENGDGKPRWYYGFDGPGPARSYPIPDRERGALRRLDKIRALYPGLLFYVQGDPRGCGLYVMRKSDLKAGELLDCVYTRGIGVCI